MRNHVTGLNFEKFTSAFFEKSENFKVVYNFSNRKIGKVGDYDLVLRLSSSDIFYHQFAGLVPVECKDRISKTNQTDVLKFTQKATSLNLKLGFFATNATFTKDANEFLYLNATKGHLIVPLFKNEMMKVLQNNDNVDDYIDKEIIRMQLLLK